MLNWLCACLDGGEGQRHRHRHQLKEQCHLLYCRSTRKQSGKDKLSSAAHHCHKRLPLVIKRDTSPDTLILSPSSRSAHQLGEAVPAKPCRAAAGNGDVLRCLHLCRPRGFRGRCESSPAWTVLQEHLTELLVQAHLISFSSWFSPQAQPGLKEEPRPDVALSGFLMPKGKDTFLE